MKLSSASTRMPRASRASQRCEPMKPAPPETTTRSLLALPLVAADTPIREPELAHRRRVVDVAPVHDHRHSHRRLDAVEVEMAKLVPFRDDYQRIAAVGDAVSVAHVLDLRQLDARAFHGRGIKCADVSARGEQDPCDVEARRFAKVVGVRLESEAEQADDANVKVLQ